MSTEQPPCEMKICRVTAASGLHAGVLPPNITKEQEEEENIEQTVKHVFTAYLSESVATLVKAEAGVLVVQSTAQFTASLQSERVMVDVRVLALLSNMSNNTRNTRAVKLANQPPRHISTELFVFPVSQCLVSANIVPFRGWMHTA